ncbi:MAG: metallophosphoesterase [Actinomycetota bacterium]|nr:metallophosphoesterase [Actinomycetota bacterium]
MIRIAAVGDIHLGTDCAGVVRERYAKIADEADVLLLAGDLTRLGTLEEAAVVAAELGNLAVPTVAVLGNHDHHGGVDKEIAWLLEEGGIILLEGEAMVLEVGEQRLGIAGVKGFGGGFAGACATEFGEELMKQFVRATRHSAERLADALARLEADYRVALTHFSPTDTTLTGEPVGIHAFLGSYVLGEAVDGELAGVRADLAIHGHAHRGTERGVTAGGVVVRNVAQPVIHHPYRIYCLGGSEMECATGGGEHRGVA